MSINKKTHQKWSVQALLHMHPHTRTHAHTHKKKLMRSKKKNQFQNITSETPGKMWQIAAIFFFFFFFISAQNRMKIIISIKFLILLLLHQVRCILTASMKDFKVLQKKHRTKTFAITFTFWNYENIWVKYGKM